MSGPIRGVSGGSAGGRVAVAVGVCVRVADGLGFGLGDGVFVSDAISVSGGWLVGVEGAASREQADSINPRAHEIATILFAVNLESNISAPKMHLLPRGYFTRPSYHAGK